MSTKKPGTTIYIDKSHPTQDKTCAISIRITYEGIRRYYPTPYRLTILDFEKVMSPKPRQQFKEIFISLYAFEKKAIDIINAMHIFTFPAFDKKYRTDRGISENIYLAFENKIKNLKSTDQIGTASTYLSAMISLQKFQFGIADSSAHRKWKKEMEAAQTQPVLSFTDVTPAFLFKYEKWMLQQDNSKTTIGIYLRNLRAIFNEAIDNDERIKDIYPFGEKVGNYQIQPGDNIKKAIDHSDIKLIYTYSSENKSKQKARDFWCFFFLANGMNVKDACRLKYKDIEGNYIKFVRAKTERTAKERKEIRVFMHDEIKMVIDKYGNKNREPGNYIFPILNKGIDPEKERKLIQQFTSVLNDNMKKVGEELGIKDSLNTYSCRHSFSTVLQRKGESISYIQEALGHTDIRTTMAYLKGFTDKKKEDVSKMLTDF